MKNVYDNTFPLSFIHQEFTIFSIDIYKSSLLKRNFHSGIIDSSYEIFIWMENINMNFFLQANLFLTDGDKSLISGPQRLKCF